MIGFILGLGRFIPAWLKRAVAWAAVAAVALLGAWGAGKRDGHQAAKKRAAEDALNRTEKGRKSADKAKRSDATPDEIWRQNDGRWK